MDVWEEYRYCVQVKNKRGTVCGQVKNRAYGRQGAALWPSEEQSVRTSRKSIVIKCRPGRVLRSSEEQEEK